MADSFSIGPSQAVNPGEIPAGQATQMGVSGGQNTMTSAGAGTFIGDASLDTTGRTLQALTGLAKEMLEPHVQRMETELFFDGMQKAIQGQGMQEVIDEQPGWSKIFGRNSVIRGASAVTAMQKVDAFAQLAAEKMPEWRKLDPSQVRKEMLAVFPQMYTGDAATDAVVQQKMLESVAPLMKHQVKEHLKWQGEEYLRKTGDSVVSAGAAINQRGLELAKSPDSPSAVAAFESAKEDFKLSLQRPPGIEDAAYEKLFLGTYRQLAQKGNFHAVRLIEQLAESSGLDQAKLAAAADFADKQESQHALTSGAVYFATKAGELRAAWTNNRVSPADAVGQALELNRQYFSTYGMKRPIFSAQEIETLTATSWGKAYTDAEAERRQKLQDFQALQKETDKENAILASVSSKAQAYLAGSRPSDWKMPGETQDMLDSVLTKKFLDSYNDPKERGPMIQGLVRGANASGGYVPAGIKDFLRKGVNSSIGEQWTKDFDTSYGMFQEIYKAPGASEVSRVILGQTTVDNMLEYSSLLKQGLSRETAYKVAFVMPKPKAEWTPDRRKELESAIGSDLSYWFKFDAPAYTKKAVADRIMGHSAPLGSFLAPGESRARAGIKMAEAAGMELVGDFVWGKNKPGDPSFGELVTRDPTLSREPMGQPGPLSEAFNAVVRRQAELSGVPTGTLSGKLDIEGFIAYPREIGSSMDESGKLQSEQVIEMSLFTSRGLVPLSISSVDVRREFKKAVSDDIKSKHEVGKDEEGRNVVRNPRSSWTPPHMVPKPK